MANLAKRRPNLTSQAIALGEVVWFILRQNGFQRESSLRPEGGFRLWLDRSDTFAPNLALLEYYIRVNKDREDAQKEKLRIEAIERETLRLHACLVHAFLPILGASNTELCLHLKRSSWSSEDKNSPVESIHITFPPENLLRQLREAVLP